MSTFVIKYAMVVNTNRGTEYIDNNLIIVKNQFNELGAKVNLEKYLQRKYGNNFIRLEVKECAEDLFDMSSEFFKGRF